MEDESDPGRLFAAMEERAREERGRIETEASVRAARIVAEAQSEVERIRAIGRAELRRELVVEGRRLLGAARLEARLERLRVKRSLLAEVFAGAEEAIARMKAGRGYRDALDALAAEARAFIGEPCSVEVRAEDASVIVTSEDGRRRADNGLATRIAAVRVGEEPQVAKILFGARNSPSPPAAGQAAKGGPSS